MSKMLDIAPPEFERLLVTIEGTTPLLQNPKTAEYIAEILGGSAGTKRGMAKKKAKDPTHEFQTRLRQDKDGAYLHPVEAFTGRKGVLASALSLIDAKKMKLYAKTVMAGVTIEPDVIIDTPEGIRAFVKLDASTPVADMHMATVQNMKSSVPVPVFRPRFDDWKIVLSVKFNAQLISHSQLIQLFTNGGVLGIGAYRRENGGNFGTFRVTQVVATEAS